LNHPVFKHSDPSQWDKMRHMIKSNLKGESIKPLNGMIEIGTAEIKNIFE